MPTSPLRSALFVPGSRPERFAKALAAGADAVIVDFEDAVEEALKPHARQHLADFLRHTDTAQVMVRVNAPGHAQHASDLAFCANNPGVVGVVLPKTETCAQLATACQSGKPLWPIIESAKGLLALQAIAHGPGVQRLCFGSLDLALDLGLSHGTPAAEAFLDQGRMSVQLHSRAAALLPPLDGVFAALDDTPGLQRAIEHARNLGYGGALCIHPRQVAVIHAALAPSAAELQWAHAVLAASTAAKGAGAFQFDGQMIDAPVLLRARRLVESSGG
ncbi:MULTISPECIES: HpcH/HpaI aldolase/citrate lyase family protein [unclassified Pseudomonas]|uniref:HpcH/HpaI aldolase/citrate lyase family protein n=1 Tax=unclassified Pseudomonas TaxID=196821 RepID=UPI00177BADFF|nr:MULTISPECIES: CoA ester lyase [unclassified Pseudomonas]MBD8601109.1 CoA ester lyase [Pseudomonas sp. CFBP 8771]MBD8731186.1 CoA ester lyase [Pseudomonas sp. CFBP 13710]MBD8828066.1 CoA ester lyase [Pseudomonas sp. CFBP 13602]